jgi:hypothetical protein
MRRNELILKVLRPIARAYEFPPLSWVEAGVSWCAATKARFAVTMVACWSLVVVGIVHWLVTA